MYTLRVDCTPSLHTLVYDITKKVRFYLSICPSVRLSASDVNSVFLKVSSPEEGEEGMTLYQSWHKRDNSTERDAPR